MAVYTRAHPPGTLHCVAEWDTGRNDVALHEHTGTPNGVTGRWKWR